MCKSHLAGQTSKPPSLAVDVQVWAQGDSQGVPRAIGKEQRCNRQKHALVRVYGEQAPGQSKSDLQEHLTPVVGVQVWVCSQQVPRAIGKEPTCSQQTVEAEVCSERAPRGFGEVLVYNKSHLSEHLKSLLFWESVGYFS